METQQEVKNTGRPRCLAQLHWIRDTIADVQERKRERERERKRNSGGENT